MSFIAFLDGNEMKWKIEKKIRRSGERIRDKRNIIAKKGSRQQRQLLDRNIRKWHDGIHNESFSVSTDDRTSPAYRSLRETNKNQQSE